MAKLGALPAQDIISGAKGTIDYYVLNGVAIVRKWPRRGPDTFPPSQRAQWPVFADAVSLWTTLDPSVQAAYNAMASGSTMTGRDMMVKMYINAKTILPY